MKKRKLFRINRQSVKITKQPLKGEDGYKVFSIRLLEETVDELDHISAESGLSRNRVIDIILCHGIKNYKFVK